MARKKRLQEVTEAPEQKPQEPVFYQDAFQATANKQIGELSKKVEGKGKTILYAIAALVVLSILVGLIMQWNRRSGGTSQAALGRAIETSQAPVTNQPVPPTYTGKVFKTEKERAEAAVAEFESVASTYGGDVGEKAKYFAAVNRMSVDRNAAIQDLEAISKTGGDVGTLAKFALANAKLGDEKLDDASALYQELSTANQTVVATDSINFALASIYEKQGKKTEAADLYFKIAEAASKAKDSDGKPLNKSQTATEAKTRLESLDPTKAATIKEEAPSEKPS